MKRVLITGASGFVGANLARRLVSEGHEVHALLRPQHNPWRIESFRSSLRMHTADFGNTDQLSQTVRQIQPEWIFHLAVQGAYSWQTDFADMIQTNLIATVNLVEACLETGFEAFVNTGSSSEYGFKNHAPSENELLAPNSHYAVTKAASTLFCCFKARTHGVHLPTLRLYSVYGPYEDPGRLIPSLVTRGLRGQLPSLVHPDVARDYIHVDDVIEAYLLAANSRSGERGAIYNVGSGIQTSLRDLVELTRRVLGVTAAPSWDSMPNRPWDTDTWVADILKIQKELGWQPRLKIENGLRRTVEWFEQNPQLLEFYESKPAPNGGAQKP
jgi:nucleoside-diphosphate-sugar epimerase